MIEQQPANNRKADDQKMWSGFWWGMVLGGVVAFLRGPRVDVRGAAQETIDGTRERISDATETVRSVAEDTIEDTRERISEATGIVRDAAQDTIEGTRERITGATETMRETFESLKPVDTIKDSINVGKEAARQRKTELNSPSEMGSPSDVG